MNLIDQDDIEKVIGIEDVDRQRKKKIAKPVQGLVSTSLTATRQIHEAMENLDEKYF